MTNMMRVRWIVGWVVIFTLVAAIGYAQQPPTAAPTPAGASSAAAVQDVPTRALGLAEALDIARRNNPDYLSTLNDRWPVSARERSSLLSLLTPTATVSAGTRHTAAGTTFFSATPFPSPANTQNAWSLSLNYLLSGTTLANRGLASADAQAVDADAGGALIVLETSVRLQYLNLLQAIAQKDLAQRSLERSQENLNLAQARYSVGQGTLIDVRRAEVDKGQAEVNLLTARQAVDNQTLVLFQQMGVPAPDRVQIVPTDSFPVTQPAFTEDSLIRLSLEANPGLVSLRARAVSARWSTRSAYSQYLPSFQVSGSFGAYRQDNDAYTRTGTDSAGNPISIPVAASSTSAANPFSLFVGVSVPIYDGFSRASTIQLARAQEDDARQAIRARELSVRAGVSAAYRALVVDWEKIGLQQRNKAAAAEALDLGTQRYRVGSGTYLELLDARLAADQADANYVTAIYDYHKAIATLENAVGRPLR